MASPEHWGCDIRIDHDHVLTIEANCIFGRELAENDEEVIRNIAEHLLCFVGKPKQTSAAQSAEGE